MADPLTSRVMRADWRFRDSLVCLRHRKLAYPNLVRKIVGTARRIQTRLSQILSAIPDGLISQKAIEPLSFDRSLDNRLETMSDTIWLGGMWLNVAATIGHFVGLRITFVEGGAVLRDAVLARHHAFAVGFGSLMQGGRLSRRRESAS